MKKILLLFLFSSCIKQYFIPDAKVDPKKSVILCLGNSLTLGYALPPEESYPGQLSRLISDTVINKGISGISTEKMIPLISSDVDPFYDSSKNNIAVVWEIGNSIFWNKMTADSAYGIFADYCNILKNKGWKIIAVTLPYRNNYFGGYPVTPGGDDSTSYLIKINRVNELLKTGFTVAEVNLTSYDPDCYLPDHIHLNAAGYAIVAEAVKKVL